MMDNQVLLPLLPTAITRTRLLTKLGDDSQHRLTLVSAPSGYGKTTLVSQYVQRLEIPVIWLTITPYDRDITGFYQQLITRLKSAFPTLQALHKPSKQTAQELASQITEQVYQYSPQRLLIVVDDLHLLDDAPQAASLLRALIQTLPQSIRFILVSRTIPSLPYLQMVARSEVLPIDQNDLRFTESELNELAQLVAAKAWTTDDLRRLALRLDGWPAGLRLALQPLPPELNAVVFGEDGPERLFHSLADDMLRAQLPALTDFLLGASTLDEVTSERCTTILGLTLGETWLPIAWSQNLFVSRRGSSYSFQKLFQEALQARLKAQDRTRFVDLHMRAAQWFAEHDDLIAAFDHYMTAETYSEAAQLAERAAREFYGQGKFETLLTWYERLETVGVSSAWLAYTCSIIFGERYQYDHAELVLEKAAQLGHAADIQRAFLDQQRGRAEVVINQAEYLLALPPESAHLRARALRVLGLAHVRLGNNTEAISYLEETVKLYEKSGDGASLSHTLLDLQLAYSELGKLDKVGECIQASVNLQRHLGGVGALAMALNNQGYFHTLFGEYQEAISAFDEGLKIVGRMQDRRSESYLCWSLGDFYRDIGAWSQAVNLYGRALNFAAGREPHLECSIMLSLATLHRWQGQLIEALTLAESVETIATDHKLVQHSRLAIITRASIRALLEGYEQADEVISSTLASMLASPSTELPGVLALLAWKSERQHQTAEALAYLRQSVQLTQLVGTAQPLAIEIANVPALRALVDQGGLHKQPMLQEQLSALAQAKAKFYPTEEPKVQPSAGDRPSEIKVFTLGQEMIVRNGEAVKISAWRGAQAREIFLYLLFHEGETREALSEIFWGNMTDHEAKHTFHQTLYQARRALGKEVIALDRDRYYINPEIDVWCDALMLDKYVRKARPLPVRDPHGEHYWRKAAALYQGPCLLTIDDEWTVVHRENAEMNYLQALTALAHCARHRGDGLGAVQFYKLALKVDSYREDIHRSMISCLVEDLGQRGLAKAHYDYVQELFAAELGISPSFETQALAQLLLI